MNHKYVEIKRTDPRPRDRGDVRRIVRIPKEKTDIETQMSKEYLADRGDSYKLNQKEEKTKTLQRKENENKFNKKFMRTEQKIAVKALIDRKRELARRYTFKILPDALQPQKEIKKQEYNPTQKPDKNKQVEFPDFNETPQYIYEIPQPKERKQSPSIPVRSRKNSAKKNIGRLKTTSTQKHLTRKPVIKTVTRKEGSVKIYKAVSFVEHIPKTTPLTLHLPHNSQSSRSSPRQKTPESSNYANSTKSNKSDSNKSKVGRDSNLKRTSPAYEQRLTLKNKKSKTRSRRKHPSPDLKPSPPPPLTEVAKWAPESINDHTKPYYEAWVNTTLTATSMDEHRHRYSDKPDLMKMLQRALDHPREFTEKDLSDERYTGRIRVRK